MKLSDNIRYYRARASMSEETLARLLGVDVKVVKRWESGSLKPDGSELHFIACALDVEDGALTGAIPRPSEKLPAEEHDHAAFDGGVLGQPDGIYGESEKSGDAPTENKTDTAVPPTANASGSSGASGGALGAGTAGTDSSVYRAVPSQDMAVKMKFGDRLLWRGKPSSLPAGKNGKSSVFGLFIALGIMMFVMISILNSTSAGSAMPVMIVLFIWGIFLFMIIRNILRPYTMRRYTEYYVTSSEIIVVSDTRNGEHVTRMRIRDIAQMRIVNERPGGAGTLFFSLTVIRATNVTLPPMNYQQPAPVFYDIENVRAVRDIVSDAYSALKKAESDADGKDKNTETHY